MKMNKVLLRWLSQGSGHLYCLYRLVTDEGLLSFVLFSYTFPHAVISFFLKVVYAAKSFCIIHLRDKTHKALRKRSHIYIYRLC